MIKIGMLLINIKTLKVCISFFRWELKNQITNTLASGTSIICDRYAFSGVAYTSSKPGFSLKWCMGPDRGLPKPDLVLYLRASEKLAQSRSDYGTERYEKRDFQNKVTEMFEKIRAVDETLTWADYTVEGGIDDVTDDLYGMLKEVLNSDLEKEVRKLWTE